MKQRADYFKHKINKINNNNYEISHYNYIFLCITGIML